jgi:glycosyltransferase involved in cell wall biosynthesis
MIVISGNMFHPPNVEGVLYFARRVFPRVSAAYPDAKLVLVGANPVEAIRSLAVENPHIEVTGTVPDVRPYLRRACVSACPVLLAIGTQTKILEAMASGTPVVTTIEGNHGIGAESGRELIIASSEKQFAASVVMLLQGEDWAGYSSRGRALVEARFDWRRIVGYLASVLETMIAERRAGQS